MSKTYRVLEGQYKTIDEAIVEITEQVEVAPLVNKVQVSVENIKDTIATLEQRKIDVCKPIDEEINLNKARLEEILPLVQDVEIIEEEVI